MFRITVLVVALAFLSACGVQRTAEDMVKTSGQIRDDSQHLAKRTDDLEAELSKKESFAEFDLKTDDLFGEHLSLFNWNSWTKNPEPDLLIDSAAAVEALPFQLWKGDYHENFNDLDLRFKFSLQAIFLKTFKHIPRNFEIDNMNPDRSYKGVASFSAMLNRLSDGYVRNVTANNVAQISLYDVIVTALENRNVLNRQEILPKASDMVRQYWDNAIYMLQLRQNYLPMMVLSRITDFTGRSDIARLWMIVTHTHRLVNLDTLQAPDSALLEWTSWLRQAEQTRADLKKMGLQPQFNSTFAELLGNVDFAPPAGGAPALKKIQLEFISAYRAVVDEERAPVPADQTPLAGP